MIIDTNDNGEVPRDSGNDTIIRSGYRLWSLETPVPGGARLLDSGFVDLMRDTHVAGPLPARLQLQRRGMV
jgi:hypothetical protein